MARCRVSLEKKSSKNYIRCESEPSQAATHGVPPAHLLAKRRVLRADFPRGEAKSAKKNRSGNSPWQLATLRGEGGVICGLISFANGSIVLRQFNMKVDSDVLLLSYLDKICLTLTGDLRRALASLYSGARLYKGLRTATRPQSTALHSTGNISV
jgi:hypothetical protein